MKGKARALILEEIRKQKYDVVFTTPETLYSEDMKRILPDLNIDLFVVDECHCISDWGHDFRPEYGELYDVLSTLPDNVSVLGTTATANDRVLRDLKKQFGSNVYISRGALTRESLHIQILHLDTKAGRYAWIRRNIDKLPGSGIIYCLTQRDCQNLSDFLCREGISARPYYSSDYLNKIDDLTGMSLNEETEQLFLDNQIKVIVATIKLGMGYDKSDIGFVIHFQRPNSIVAYYQQIGRAGRQEGSNAYCFLMAGKEDRAISEYFIENAFPTEQQEQQVISALEQAEDGLRKYDFSSYCNISPKALEHTIHILRIHKMIYREGNRYYRSMVPYKYPGVYYSEVKKTKYEELDVMNQYTETKECLSRFIVSELNDDTAYNCGKCANCLRKDVLPGLEIPDIDEISEIQEELNALYIEILPRKKWPEINTLDDKTKISIPNEVGLALSRYGEVGIGEMVKFDKYAANYFREELVKRSAIVIIEKLKGKNYDAVTSVPSFTNSKVEKFARQVAEEIGIPYLQLLEKVPGQQANMKNILNGKLLLYSHISPYTLNTRNVFVAAAMERNKFIYSSSSATVVVRSEKDKGGTWTGATESLRHKWAYIYVWDQKEYAGNQKLIEMGAVPLSDEGKIVKTKTNTIVDEKSSSLDIKQVPHQTSIEEYLNS